MTQVLSITPRPAVTPLSPLVDTVLAGLRAPLKRLPAVLLYDERGSSLFERICQLDAYYLTRTELVLLRTHLPAIASHIGPAARVIEPGSGAPTKATLLLTALDAPAVYVPIDVCSEQLAATAAVIRSQGRGVEVTPLCTDYTAGPIELPLAHRPFARTLVFWPGSTIGNLEPDDAVAQLARFGELAGPGAVLLLGADSTDDPDLLLRAYDDDAGITAEFDRNVLAHVNRIAHATFDPDAFVHRAVWDPVQHRVEMHLISRHDQTVHVAGHAVAFRRGEPIVTEHCYKHPAADLARMLGHAGWSVRRTFADDVYQMRLWLCTANGW